MNQNNSRISIELVYLCKSLFHSHVALQAGICHKMDKELVYEQLSRTGSKLCGELLNLVAKNCLSVA